MAANLAASQLIDFRLVLAPQVGLEPTTLRLTAECSAPAPRFLATDYIFSISKMGCTLEWRGRTGEFDNRRFSDSSHAEFRPGCTFGGIFRNPMYNCFKSNWFESLPLRQLHSHLFESIGKSQFIGALCTLRPGRVLRVCGLICVVGRFPPVNGSGCMTTANRDGIGDRPSSDAIKNSAEHAKSIPKPVVYALLVTKISVAAITQRRPRW